MSSASLLSHWAILYHESVMYNPTCLHMFHKDNGEAHFGFYYLDPNSTNNKSNTLVATTELSRQQVMAVCHEVTHGFQFDAPPNHHNCKSWTTEVLQHLDMKLPVVGVDQPPPHRTSIYIVNLLSEHSQRIDHPIMKSTTGCPIL
ncbi:hypothetical protein DFA_09811 [Cavenderia fasciculata]|uniref:Uncharacterized protein n=1 Tax=Cavenderia fasciculata TaxID=261658 RepID=F4QAS3_CACFS|nr:uncharacterized protein DFA_09811 [Cavenderia fasciculata]EGG14991.1 hypothetical protein DFA_09811 [Cavenderia fasciculata]|eukprot:XP_004351711.1 hypothetical protein DFA_09811 [Cavenderia fasciculata]